MNTKSLGGVLTPNRGFVCLRCRLGNGIINLGRTRRYQQTNAQSAISDADNHLPFQKPGDSHDSLKSNSEPPAGERQPTSIVASTNAPTKPHYTTRQEPIADTSNSKPVQSESESQALLQKRYLELRRNLLTKHVHFSQLEERQNQKAVSSVKVNVPGGLKFTKTKQEQPPPTDETKASKKRDSVKDTKKSKQAEQGGRNEALTAGEKRGSVKDATESKRATKNGLIRTCKSEKRGLIRTPKIGEKSGLIRTCKTSEKSGSVKDATESKRATKNGLIRTCKTGEKSGSVKDATESKRATKNGLIRTCKTGEKSGSVKDATESKRAAKIGSNKTIKVGEGSSIIKYTMGRNGKTEGGSNKAAKIIKKKAGVKSERAVERRLDKAGKVVDEVAEVKAVKIRMISVRANAESKEILKPPGMFSMPRGHKIHHLKAKELKISVIPTEGLSVPSLSYGLERVLFNPGVFQLQDPRSRVFNFDPYLQTIMPVEEFNFNALKRFTTSSQDENLKRLAEVHGKRYRGSSSSMTGVLSHFHYLLSQWRELDFRMLSRNFTREGKHKSFTKINKSPIAIFLRWRDGTYAIDGDKEFDSATVLSSLGTSMEKLLTSDAKDFERYRKSNSDQISPEDNNSAQDYHYSTMGDILMRSQLDAYDSRLPGTGIFDLKTRSVVSIRMDVTNYKLGVGYQIKSPQGKWESYEREYFDMIRSAFLKYSLQVRMGRMDGVFVAYHNVERIFGFQYIPLPEIDKTIHGTSNTTIGDQEFRMSLGFFNRILDKATKKFPKTSLRLHFETREVKTPFMYVFAEPMTEVRVQEIQSRNAAKVEEFERNILGLEGGAPSKEHEQEKEVKWADIEASVQEAVAKDEKSLLDGNMDQESSFEVADNLNSDPSHKHDYNNGSLYRDNTIEDQDDENVTASSSVGDGQTDTVDGEDEDGTTRSDDQKDVEEASDEETEVDDDEAEENTDCETDEDEMRRNNKEKRELPEIHRGDEHGALSSIVGLDSAGHGQTVALDEEPLPDDGSSSSGTKVSDFGDQEVPAEAAGARDEPHEVLAMTLTVRNKVNGKYVTRPTRLGQTDDWTIEYSLAEEQNAKRAWSLYMACKQRRQGKLQSLGVVEDGNEGDFIRMLRDMSRQGTIWRKGMDKKDEARPRVVLEPPVLQR